MKIKIIYALIGLALYLFWLAGLGTLLVWIYGVDISGTDPQLNPITVYLFLGAMHVGIFYAIYSAIDFSVHVAREMSK